MMSIHASFAALVSVLSGCALACCGAPRGFALGAVAIDLSGVEGTVSLRSLGRGSSEQIAVKAGETRIADVPAGSYSVELVTDAPASRGSASVPRAQIVVAPGKVTTLRLAPASAPSAKEASRRAPAGARAARRGSRAGERRVELISAAV
jgi:hypothetical protein